MLASCLGPHRVRISSPALFIVVQANWHEPIGVEALKRVHSQRWLLLAIKSVELESPEIQAPTGSASSVQERASSFSLLRLLAPTCGIHFQPFRPRLRLQRHKLFRRHLWPLMNFLPLSSQTEIYLIPLLWPFPLPIFQESPTIKLRIVNIIYPCSLIEFEALLEVLQNQHILLCELLAVLAFPFCDLCLPDTTFADTVERTSWTE
jgi:hypothetical protein